MPDNDPKIKELEDRLDRLVRTQIDFQKEVSLIRGEIIRLRAQESDSSRARSGQSPYASGVRPPMQRPSAIDPAKAGRPASSPPPATEGRGHQASPASPQTDESAYEMPKRPTYSADPILSEATVTGGAFSRFVAEYTENARANLEEFVGKNLISLIGIIVLVLGVGIGAKYAIDNNLISPLTRIIIGYIFGFGLVGLAIKFKRNYHNFSAVLISGGMAIMYFVTFFAYSSYALISQLPAFGLMVMFTAGTVAAALVYRRQVIAHIGLVGAYAVPFLLSNDSGNYLALFIYMSVINAGILAVSLKQRWIPIFYTSSLFTWAIFCGWFSTRYVPQDHFTLTLTFLAVFFGIFYSIRIAELRSLPADDDGSENLIATGITTAIFYIMCFAVLMNAPLAYGQYWAFFAYVALVSLVIIGASIRLYPPAVLYGALISIWAIFSGWFATAYSHAEYFQLALTFLGVFFVISYAVTLIQTRYLADDSDRLVNTAASLMAGGIFYVFCFVIITDPLAETPRYGTMFGYIAVASIAMLATSFKFFGRVFMYLVVPAIWLIYGSWFFTRYDEALHFELASVFAALFFAVCYFSILYHRLIEDNFTLVEHTSLVLANAFTFYGFGYVLMESRDAFRDYLGLYTAANGALHLIVAFVIRGLKPKAVDVTQVLTVLVLTFASLAVPVQFDGNLVTMIWAVEGAILFWFGRTRVVPLFERFSVPVLLLATLSLGLEWTVVSAERASGTLNAVTPFANADFITALVYVIAFALVYITNRSSRYTPAFNADVVRPFGYVIAAAGCVVLYNMFRMEVSNYFHLAAVNLGKTGATLTGTGSDLHRFSLAWQINYTIFFFIATAAANLKKLRSTTLATTNVVLGTISIAAFAVFSMFIFHELRTIYMAGTFDPDFIGHWMYIAIRPISYAIVAVLVYLLYEYSRDPLLEERVDAGVRHYGFDALAYTLVFIVTSCELINLMGQLRWPDATKLGLSILWGVYALVLVMIGIGKDKKHLRIAAMTLLAVTLAKLFFYDIADLDTIPKTILFVTLGITLLVISFLYNKYKGVIFKADAVQED